MSDEAFAALGDNVQAQMKESAAKMTGDDELEAEAKRQRAEADGLGQDETGESQETESLTTGIGATQSAGPLDDVDLEPPSS